MTAPIYSFLEELNKKNIYPFHMPGHKRKALFNIDPFSFDITEICGADNLHKPDGIIKQAQQLMAKLAGADESFFCVNGSSAALMAAIMSVCKPNEKILAARNCHRSVYNGILLSGASPVYIYPQNLENSIPAGISPHETQEALNLYPDIKAMIITSPTYEGFCSNIKEIADILHKKNLPLIVDEAHGAHFGFDDYFPKSALSQGADLVIQSWHKTLPVFTQTGVAHIKSDIIDRDLFFSYLSMLQTTSPSYLFMAVLDKCRDILQTQSDKLFKAYAQRLDELRSSLLKLKKFRLIDKEILNKASIAQFDKGKLVFEINCDKNVNLLEKMFIKDYNFQIESAGLNHIILMTSIMDTKKDFKMLLNALNDAETKLNFKAAKKPAYIKKEPSNPEISPHNAFKLKKRLADINECENKICADFLIPYPPGVPLLAPGEIIKKSDIEAIKNIRQCGINIIGLNNKYEISVCDA